MALSPAIRSLCTLALVVSSLAISSAFIPFQNRTWPQRNTLGQPGFPTYAEAGDFVDKLDGTYLSPMTPGYINASYMINLRVMRAAALIVYPVSVQDIQMSVSFARKYNLHLCIRSSGHSYIGRSTHDGSLVIDLRAMRGIDFNLTSSRNPAGEVTVQSGASWIEVYEKVNTITGPDSTLTKKTGRVVVGGSAHTVAMGGYTQGGGHAPICRKLGLAVDNLLEATLVTADGQIMTVSADKTIIHNLDGSTRETTDTSLFWAIRGGGGGTWGVVVTFTYKLHYAPERFRRLNLYYPMFSATDKPIYEDSVRDVLREANKLSEDWGGYLILAPGPIAQTPYKNLFLVVLIHFGNDSSPSNHEVDNLIAKTNPIYKTDDKFATFLDYEVNAVDALYYTTYIANTFVQPETITDNDVLNNYTNFLYKQIDKGVGCTMTLIGGDVIKSHPRPATPVHPGFRNAIFSQSCGISWHYDPTKDAPHIRQMLDVAEVMYTFGNGSYFNEPAEDMPDWKQRFWADDATYQRLLAIKKKYDPDNYFWCHNCIASDLGAKYGPPTSNVFPGYYHDNTTKSRDSTPSVFQV